MQINRLICTRHNEIVDQHPGALLTNDQPIIIWVDMLERPKANYDNRALEKVFALCWKFNDLMNNTTNQAGHSVMHMDEPLVFDFSGNLTTAEKVKFWCQFDSNFKEMHYSFLNRKHSKGQAFETSSSKLTLALMIGFHIQRCGQTYKSLYGFIELN